MKAIGKSEFRIEYYDDSNFVNNIIVIWLNQNKFLFNNNNIQPCYVGQGGYFEYYFKNNKVILYAYHGSINNPHPLNSDARLVNFNNSFGKRIIDLINKICNYSAQNGKIIEKVEHNGTDYKIDDLPLYWDEHCRQQREELVLYGIKMAFMTLAALVIMFVQISMGNDNEVVPYLVLFLAIIFAIGAYVFTAMGIKSDKKNLAITCLVIYTVLIFSALTVYAMVSLF